MATRTDNINEALDIAAELLVEEMRAIRDNRASPVGSAAAIKPTIEQLAKAFSLKDFSDVDDTPTLVIQYEDCTCHNED